MLNLKQSLVNSFNQLYNIHTALGNKFEALSYQKIIDILYYFNKPIYSSDDLKNIEGIGKNTLTKVDEFAETGKIKILDDLLNDEKVSAQLYFYKILGVGPKIAQKWVELGYKNIDDLIKNDIKLTNTQKIGIKYYNKLNQKIPRSEISSFFISFSKIFKKKYPGLHFLLAGSYRRGKLSSNDIDIIIQYNKNIDYNKVYSIISHFSNDIISKSKNSITFINKRGRKVDVKFVESDKIGFFLLYFGSGEIFSRKIRGIAKEKGLKLSEKGLYDIKNKRYVLKKAKNEEIIFNYLDQPFITPNKR